MNYERLIKRRKQLLGLGNEYYKQKKDSREYDMELYSIDHFFECENYKIYEHLW